MLLGFLVAGLWSTSAKAEDYTLVSNSALQSQHDWDHIGMSFVVQTASYGFFRKALKMKKEEAILFSLVTSTMVTSIYSLQNNSNTLGRDIGMNFLGAALSVGTCLVFDF